VRSVGDVPPALSVGVAPCGVCRRCASCAFRGCYAVRCVSAMCVVGDGWEAAERRANCSPGWQPRDVAFSHAEQRRRCDRIGRGFGGSGKKGRGAAEAAPLGVFYVSITKLYFCRSGGRVYCLRCRSDGRDIVSVAVVAGGYALFLLRSTLGIFGSCDC
jgi:hypothetical protein